MATQLVQYSDLRHTIDVNPPAYECTSQGGEGHPTTTNTTTTTATFHQPVGEECDQHSQELAQSKHQLISLQLDKDKEINTPSEVARVIDLDSDTSHQTSRQSSKQESRPSTKDTKTSGKSLAGRNGGKENKSPTRMAKDSKSGSRASGARPDGREFADVAIQDEGGDPTAATVEEKFRTPNTRNSKRTMSTLAPVLESDLDAFDLFDDESWAAVPGDKMKGRFAQYRRLGTHRLLELEEQLQLTTAKTKRKVTTLKAQFQEHKGKWEAERHILIGQVDQSLRLKTDAEKETDAAMTQLEDFITEQEKLEQEEESKGSEVVHASAPLTPQDGLTPIQSSLVTSPTGAVTPGVAQLVMLIPESEQELQRLMQQTDDAKVKELNARLGTCVSAPPTVGVVDIGQQASGSVGHADETLSSLEAKIEGCAEEEIRSSSAQSRASLRNMFKAKLVEGKTAAEDRRSRSPAIQLPTQMTIDDELIWDEDDHDEEEEDNDDNEEKEEEDEEGDERDVERRDGYSSFFDTHKDPSMFDISTSPPPNLFSRDSTLNTTRYSQKQSGAESRKGGTPRQPSDAGKDSRDPAQSVIQKIIRKDTSLLKHPLLKEFLKSYEGVINFKENISKMFLDKDMMSAHQMTSDLETMNFDANQKVMPQVEELTKNVCHVLEEIRTLIITILVYDREPPVSSLNHMSREETHKSFGTPTEATSELPPPAPPVTAANGLESRVDPSREGSLKSGRQSVSSDKAHIKELQDHYNQLKIQLENDGTQHQEQQQRNTVVMMEMQDIINGLQRELSALGKSAKRTKSASSSVQGTVKAPSPETSVMFTRLDSERNTKIMKRAVVEDKLDPEKYKEAVAKMDEYVSLPAQRLVHLVKKFVHHTRMREIEEKVKNSSSMDEDVFNILDKMENLQNQRARQWADNMDEIGIERLRLANLLMGTLDIIEQESGIFLIKPMYSYRGRDLKPGTRAKLSRPLRSQPNSTPTNYAASTLLPAPTPASAYRLVRHGRHFLQQLQQLQQQQQQPSTIAEMRPVELKSVLEDGGNVKVMGSGMTFSAGSPRTTWNMQASQPWVGGRDDPNSFNTPRILELDINRMLIGQNNISSKIPYPPTDDRLINATQNSLRSYVTVNRPTATFGAEKTDKRPGSGQGLSSRPSAKRVGVSDTDRDIPAVLATATPLPPIAPPTEEEEKRQDDTQEEEEEVEVRSPFTNVDEEEGERDEGEKDEEDEEENEENALIGTRGP